MKYFHTTLAINEPYFKNSLNFFISLHEKTEHGYNKRIHVKGASEIVLSTCKFYLDS